jgi:hypothetical protein
MIAEKAWIIWNPDPTIYLHPLLHHSTNDTILTTLPNMDHWAVSMREKSLTTFPAIPTLIKINQASPDLSLKHISYNQARGKSISVMGLIVHLLE